MKNILFIIGLFFILQACSLQEEPPFLVNESVYSDANNATSALNGIYESMTNFDFLSNAFIKITNNNSGFFVTGERGQNKNNPYNSTLASLKPLSGGNYVNRLWRSHYQTISRANDAIVGINPTEGAGLSSEETILNDIVGQAYFVRAFCYFNLVRLWGDVPVRLEPSTVDNIHLAVSPSKSIYEQVISDAQNAAKYMNGAMGIGYPKQAAANFLLAKIYMHLATADPDLQDAGVDYWQMAYDEAIKVYGQYELVSDYAQLFDVDGENTVESIFEVQFSELIASDHGRSFTPQWYISINTFGQQQINAEVYDRHEAAYPGDPRIASTFLSEYAQTNNGNNITTYPTRTTRPTGNWRFSFPYLYKLGLKNPAQDTRNHNRNVIVYRYADLLLMLAEISNELQNGEQLGYISELLSRPSLNLSPRAAYSMGQDEFREAVMEEYAFELLGEGHDWFNNRRRGYQWFRDHVIDPHNNYELFLPEIDVTHETDEATVMFLPIPLSEINTNQEIN